MNIIGDVKGRSCILIDDIVDSGGTLVNAAQALLDAGAKSVAAYITHGVLSGGAVARVDSSALTELVITDTILPTDAALDSSRIRILTVAPLIGEAVRRISDESSASVRCSTRMAARSMVRLAGLFMITAALAGCSAGGEPDYESISRRSAPTQVLNGPIVAAPGRSLVVGDLVMDAGRGDSAPLPCGRGVPLRDQAVRRR